MTPSEAAEGRRLLRNRLAAEVAVPHLSRDDSALTDWLWAHREELVRCAELAAEPQGAPPGCTCGSFNGLPHAHDCPARAVWLRVKGAPREGLPPNRFEAEQAENLAKAKAKGAPLKPEQET